MKVTFDPEADALYIEFRKGETVAEELSENIFADFDAEGRLAGIEVLNATQMVGLKLPEKTLKITGIKTA